MTSTTIRKLARFAAVAAIALSATTGTAHANEDTGAGTDENGVHIHVPALNRLRGTVIPDEATPFIDEHGLRQVEAALDGLEGSLALTLDVAAEIPVPVPHTAHPCSTLPEFCEEDPVDDYCIAQLKSTGFLFAACRYTLLVEWY